MGDYISIHLEFEGSGNAAYLLRPVFSSTYFKPVALGGLHSYEGKDNWFLSGYALENFLSFFLDKGGNETLSFDLASETDGEEYHYLSFLKDQILRNRPPFRMLSPYEEINPDINVTFINRVSLAISALEQCQHWYERYPSGLLYLYGVINLMIENINEAPWKKSFRYLHSPQIGMKSIGSPFLIIRAATDISSPNMTHIMFHSRSHIWLQECGALGGLIGQHEANVNLSGLVSLAKLLVDSGITELKYADLGLDGSVFRREQDRIRSAFADMLTSE